MPQGKKTIAERTPASDDGGQLACHARRRRALVRTEEAVSSLGYVAILQTDHFRVIWGQERRDALAGDWVLVEVYRRRGCAGPCDHVRRQGLLLGGGRVLGVDSGGLAVARLALVVCGRCDVLARKVRHDGQSGRGRGRGRERHGCGQVAAGLTFMTVRDCAV